MDEWLDKDGYPTQEALWKIEKWDYLDFEELIKFIQSIWTFKDYIHTEDDKVYLSTAGWSGNEDIIEALRNNLVFWSLCWESSRRGGHYVFDMSRAPKIQ